MKWNFDDGTFQISEIPKHFCLIEWVMQGGENYPILKSLNFARNFGMRAKPRGLPIYINTTKNKYFNCWGSCLMIYDNIDISKFPKLIAFLKRTSDGYQAKKSKILTE
ncbi:hypothetical protein NQ317_013438 [Molorchus minor]|uniref:Uncharacterized protein n=1 Tax=Molorchus minor TaxID=1323400 RepID=A0ABQ9J4C4_9CUCU|nr:hypothetical protein NQ317_013438 [Molorchus minor]